MKHMRQLKFVLRVLAVLATILWIRNPESHIEPIVAAITLILSFLPEHTRGSEAASEARTGSGPPPVVPTERCPPKEAEPLAMGFPYASDSALFEQRFAQAFPGLRSSKWFHGSNAVQRLTVLLKEPLEFRLTDSRREPIWWFRNGNSSITQFKKISQREVLLDHQELIVDKIYAAYSRAYKRLFVYVQCSPSPSTGLYDMTTAERQEYLGQFGYLWEEYALFKGSMITRAEYDDNAAMVMGTPTPLHGKSELRTRYITPYNFVICAQDSPINNPNFDSVLEEYLNRALEDDAAVAELESTVARLPVRAL